MHALPTDEAVLEAANGKVDHVLAGHGTGGGRVKMTFWLKVAILVGHHLQNKNFDHHTTTSSTTTRCVVHVRTRAHF